MVMVGWWRQTFAAEASSGTARWIRPVADTTRSRRPRTGQAAPGTVPAVPGRIGFLSWVLSSAEGKELCSAIVPSGW